MRASIGVLRHDSELELRDELKRNIVEWREALVIGRRLACKCTKAQRHLAARLVEWARGMRHAHQDAAKLARLIRDGYINRHLHVVALAWMLVRAVVRAPVAAGEHWLT